MSKTRYKVDFTFGTGKGFIHIYAKDEADATIQFFNLSEEDLIACIHISRAIISIEPDDPDLTSD